MPLSSVRTRFRTLRFRLTAWYLAFFSLLFVGFGIFLYHVLASSLERRLDETLISQASTASKWACRLV